MVPTCVAFLVADFSRIYAPIFAMGLLKFSAARVAVGVENPKGIHHALAQPTAICCCRLLAREAYIMRNAQSIEYRGRAFASTEKSARLLLLHGCGLCRRRLRHGRSSVQHDGWVVRRRLMGGGGCRYTVGHESLLLLLSRTLSRYPKGFGKCLTT
jgi:hypothetical protein